MHSPGNFCPPGRRLLAFGDPFFVAAAMVLCGSLGASNSRAADAGTGAALPPALVTVWDTGAPLADSLSTLPHAGWRSVPSDLLALEANPAKASSDPGYYGREYVFRGDAVVETPQATVVFRLAKASVSIFSKGFPAVTGANRDGSGSTGKHVVDCLPLLEAAGKSVAARVELIRNAGDEAILALKLSESAKANEATVVFALDRTGTLEVKTGNGAKGVRLVSPIEYGIVPSFIGDDLLLSPSAVPAARIQHLPSENLFLGLLSGGDRELVVTWPRGEQAVRLQTDADSGGRPRFASLEVDTDGRSLFLSALAAPGLWHRQILVATNLEADVALPWKRPFPARWKTQLFEESLKTTFTFRESKGEIWRGVPGSYNYPVWFAGDQAYIHPSKKVPPKGEAVIYFLESQGTPVGVVTPADILKGTVGRDLAGELLDSAGRRLRSHHRRGEEGVHRACTCGYTEAIQDVFQSGQEVVRKDFVRLALEDMKFFVARHLERIEEYQRFAAELTRRLDALTAQSPGLKTYGDNLKEIAALIPQECSVQKDNMKSLTHADELTRRTLALTAKQDPTNLKAYLELLKAWREMGGAQDYVVAQCHILARRLHQEAGYTALNDPVAAKVSREVRSFCRQTLRNPDGYEIWAEY